MLPTEPTISDITNAATALLTVAAFTKLYFMDKKFDEVLLLIGHADVGLLARMKKSESRHDAGDVRAGRHSDALRALGADLED